MDPQSAPSLVDSTATNLLRRVKSQDQQAWGYLVQLYGPLVYYWCRKSGLQHADASDVVQEVFKGVASALETFERQGVGSFRRWLRVVTRNKITDFGRRASRQPQAMGGSSAQISIELIPDPHDILSDEPPAVEQKHVLLHKALEFLRHEIRDRTWQVFWRTTVERQDPFRVAHDLQMKVGAVYQAKSRTLLRLRELLTELEAEPEISMTSDASE